MLIFPSWACFLCRFHIYIYIYIYREREREREVWIVPSGFGLVKILCHFSARMIADWIFLYIYIYIFLIILISVAVDDTNFNI